MMSFPVCLCINKKIPDIVALCHGLLLVGFIIFYILYMLPKVRNPVMMPLLIYFGMLDHKAFFTYVDLARITWLLFLLLLCISVSCFIFLLHSYPNVVWLTYDSSLKCSMAYISYIKVFSPFPSYNGKHCCIA
jgi:hypothetical protein